MPITKMQVLALLITAGSFTIIACNKNSDDVGDPVVPVVIDPVAEVLNLPATPFNYSNQPMPAYLTSPNIAGQLNTPATNPVTDNGATLGRVLFYDKNLSLNNTISCASCHKQASGFSNPVAKSAGFNGGLTGRNSMSIIDAAYYPNGRFFWDQRAATLEDQVLMPIQDLVEMGMTLPQLETKLKGLKYYPVLFARAFNGDSTVTTGKIAAALSQFVRSIVSYRSKYDAGRGAFPAAPAPAPNAIFANFTAQENRGKEIFLSPQNACAACHGSETFTPPQERNNGLDLVTVDRGFGAVTNRPQDEATFKVTTLRNVELTAPYMHDGRFATLEEVVEHYSSGVKNHPNLSNPLRLPNGNPRNLNLSVADKQALVAFLKTLTDNTIATEVKYSNPFK